MQASMRRGVSLLGSFLLAMGAINVIAPQDAFAAGMTPKPCAGKSAGKISRSEVLKRAKSWVGKASYDQARCYTNSYGEYRADCSGYVSMAWGLPSSYLTVTLDDVSTKISHGSLKKGDVILPHSSHVSIFSHWVYSGGRKVGLVVYEAKSRSNPADSYRKSMSYATSAWQILRYKKIED